MPRILFRSPMPVAAEELYAWHARPGAFQRLNPPWDPVQVKGIEGPFPALRARIRLPILGPIGITWQAEHYDTIPGQQFRDRQVRGPFASWEHTHRMLPGGAEQSTLEDDITFRLPLGLLGQLAAGRMTRHKLMAMFAYRHAITRSDLARHARYREQPRQTIAITGSRGLIGSELTAFLTTGGHRVIRLVTGKAEAPYDDGTAWVPWDPQQPVDPRILEGVDTLVHLAAEPIASGSWTRAKRARIHASRVVPTQHLAHAASQAGVRAFLSASGVAAYGDGGEEPLPESAPRGSGFLADVCQAWEAAATTAASSGVRVVLLRIGVVLTPRGAALGKQLLPFRCGLGAVLSSGRQWVPWISMGDTIGAIHHAIMEPGMAGPMNVVAPGIVRQREFATTLGRVLRRPVFMHIPAWALRRLVGDVADPALLASMRVVPARLHETGMVFDHPDLTSALRHLLGKHSLEPAQAM